MLFIDGQNTFYRAAFTSRPETLNGQPVGAVRRLLQWLALWAPAAGGLVIALEGATSWRRDAYPAYKGGPGRTPMPPELRGQMERGWELLAAAGVPLLAADGHEADDVLATLAAREAARGMPSTILSTDRDLFACLVHPHCVVQAGGVAWTGRGFAEFWGFPPDRWADYKALAGDGSDNIPGAAMVGDAMARALVAVATLDEILTLAPDVLLDRVEARGRIPRGLAGGIGRIQADRAAVRGWRRLVALNEALPLSLDWMGPAPGSAAGWEALRLGGEFRAIVTGQPGARHAAD